MIRYLGREKIKLAISTVSISGTLPDKIKAIANAGFKYLELFESDVEASNLPPREINKLLADFGVLPINYAPFRNFEGCPRSDLANNLERAKKKFELLNNFNVDLLLLCSNAEDVAIKDDDVILNDLYKISELAKQYNIKIGYEPISRGTYVNSCEFGWKIVKTLNHNFCGIVLDTFHVLAKKEEIDYLSKIDKNKIFLLQIADSKYLNLNLFEWNLEHRDFPGMGEFDLKNFMRCVDFKNCSCHISLEIFGGRVHSLNPVDAAIQGYKSMTNLIEE